MRIRKYILTLLVLLLTCAVRAQNDTRLYESAMEAYEFGLFERTDSLLRDSVGIFRGETRIGVLRLLALSNLNMDKPEVAETWVSRLLAVDPYYRVYNDVPRFTDMVERLKQGKTATITTASQQAESLEEAPVPVTLITEEMIARIGARTLKDALVAYVPGMTDIACNEEINVAMRGIYSSGQEKILIMLNGHRLNSYSTNTASPDFSISLDKVKQIEVLRGPASSLYGGVALTGVVNIITKEGSDVDGFYVKGSMGNYGQLKGDLLFGKHYLGLDIVGWASIYQSEGQKVYLKGDTIDQPFATMPVAGDMIIDAFNRNPSYDMGFNLQWEGMFLLYSQRFSKTVAPLTLSYFFAPYSYDRYRTYNGNAPGYAIKSQHAELGYSAGNGSWTWQASVSFDSQNQQRYQVDGDTIPEVGFNDITIYGVDDVTLKLYRAVFQSVDWCEHTVGAHVQAGYEYKLGHKNSGIVLLGGHGNMFNLYDAYYIEGVDYDLILKTHNDVKVLNTGKEKSADAYLQIKHKWKDFLVFNMGIRYDYKLRCSGKKIHEFSPRVALILTRPDWSFKVSYAKSFVDSPYFYRNNTLDINFGDESLLPEYLNSVQVSFLSDKLINRFGIEANVFMNKASNFIIAEELGNVNAGSLTSAGVELVTKYRWKGLFAEANFTWQRVLDSNKFNVYNKSIFNIPDFQSNIVLSYQTGKNFELHSKANILSKQYSQFGIPGMDMYNFEIPARCIVNAGFNSSFNRVGLGMDFYNLFNSNFEQGGASVAPLRQPGMWFLGHLSYKF